MTITLNLTEEQEREVLQSAAGQDAAQLRAVLEQALEEVVQKLLRASGTREDLSGEEFQGLAAELARNIAATPHHHPLPADALTREDLYREHP
ncbi:MAG: hypothetical protein SX243_12785 [Acidobacteriota bacterium]|nr:hypothetical protein [Acidobacteriota bacterium]